VSTQDLSTLILRQIRKLDISQSELAKRSGLSRQTLVKLIQGKIVEPSISTLIQLATAMHLAPGYVIRLTYSGIPIKVENEAPPKYKKDHSSFVRDITYPDNSIVTVNQEFTKIWEIQNTGDKQWENRRLKCMDYDALILLSDPSIIKQLSALLLTPRCTIVPVPSTMPVQTVQVAVDFTAPRYPCTTISRWKMIDDAGDLCFPGLTGVWCIVNVNVVSM
jgi:transcriptional regulator with XRE-family HTH domain